MSERQASQTVPTDTGPTDNGPPLDGAQGASTITEILDEAKQLGFGMQQTARENARVECSNCDEQSNADELDIEHIRRLEGASDVDDMLMIVLAACPKCKVGGSLMLTYGPNASEIDSDVLEVIDLSSADAAPTEDGTTHAR